MRRRIKTLAPAVAGKVAAGEVIERPASALKELMENALDARAENIRIRIRDGGAALLEVQDDGEGIVSEDLPYALMRHATSKIASEEDFCKVSTFGFRGEALASLAAVSEFSLASRTANSPHGAIFSPGMNAPRPHPMASGTIVSARALFADFPGRRRFLRSPATETAHCANAATIAALCAPQTAFNFNVNGRDRLTLPPKQTPQERLTELFPKLQDNVREVAENAGALSLSGAIFAPRLGATARSIGQFFYVNDRFVRDRLLRRAVSDALRGMAHDGEPGYALFLRLPPAAVDVNMHPAKLEVRFMEPRAIFEFVRRGAAKAMSAPLGEPLNAETLPASLPPAADSKSPASPSNPAPALHSPPSSASAAAAETWRQMFGDMYAPPSSSESSSSLFGDAPLGRAIGQLHDIYIIAENKKRTRRIGYARRTRTNFVRRIENRMRQCAPADATSSRARCGGVVAVASGGARRTRRQTAGNHRGVAGRLHRRSARSSIRHRAHMRPGEFAGGNIRRRRRSRNRRPGASVARCRIVICRMSCGGAGESPFVSGRNECAIAANGRNRTVRHMQSRSSVLAKYRAQLF